MFKTLILTDFIDCFVTPPQPFLSKKSDCSYRTMFFQEVHINTSQTCALHQKVVQYSMFKNMYGLQHNHNTPIYLKAYRGM